MFRKNMRFRLFVCFFALLLLLSACQPTPEEAVVSQKGDLTDKIAETADPSQVPTGVGSRYIYEKTYETSGNTLSIDVELTGGNESKMPVLTVEGNPFESGEPMKEIVTTLFPDYQVYDYAELTQEDYDKEIKRFELALFREKNHLDPETGEPLPEGEESLVGYPIADSLQGLSREERNKLTKVEKLQIYVDELKEKATKAPRDSELKPAQYKIEGNVIPQENLRLMKGDIKYDVDFANWADRPGSIFMVKRMNVDSSLVKLPLKAELPANVKNLEEQQNIENILQTMGIDYMQLNCIYQGEDACQYIYTRAYNGAQEDYAAFYLGLTATDGDGVIAQNLWQQEYFQITMYQGMIQDITWNNPSQIVKVDNENVKILPWSEIQKIFERQIGYMLAPTSESRAEGIGPLFWKASDLRINRISLGLMKVIMKDTNEYKLIPVWSFFGQDNLNTELEECPEKCYLTINAMDGSIVDRGVMY